MINNWELDYRHEPYEDCTDGNFLCEREFTKGTILNLKLNQTFPKRERITRQVKIVASIPEGAGYKIYFDIFRGGYEDSICRPAIFRMFSLLS